MSFAWPWVFLALPLPWAMRVLLPPAHLGPALRMPQLPGDAAAPAPRAALRLWLAGFAWLLLLTAAVRPQLPGEVGQAPVSGRDLMLAFDVSMSMASADLRQGEQAVERLQAARALADGFLSRRQGDRAGLVVFGAQAYLHTPMTHDLSAVRAALGSVQAGLAGRETALGDAIALSVKYLRALPADMRVLVLLTDGANTAGTLAPQRAAWLARREGVRIHAAGVGASVELDEAALKEIAAQTGGSYARATDSGALAAFFAEVERAEPSARNASQRPMRELYAWPLALACLLAAALWAWRRMPGQTRWQRVVDAHLQPHVLVARPGGRAGRIAVAAAWLLALLALAGPAPDAADAPPAARRDSLRVLVVDLSPHAAPQLERIKLKLHALLRAPHEGETALLVYADEPYLVVPPSADPAVVARFVPDLAIDAMPVPGNRPERAAAMAAALLGRSGAGTRDIVWFSASDWPAASPPPDLKGIRLSVLHGGAGDAPVLRKTAEQTGGVLARMRNDASDLNMLADAMQAGHWERNGTAAAAGIRLGPWLLLPLLPLAALRFRRGLLALLPLALCAGLLPAPSHAARLADLEARRLFEACRHEDAAARFTDPRWKAAAHYRAGRFAEAARLLEGQEDPDSLYNRANALAKTGRLQEALEGYEASLRLRPNDADTLHNRDLVRNLLRGKRKNSGSRSGRQDAQSETDAARVAEQWLRSVPDEPGTLLRRKLQAEHRRRLAGEAERPW